MAITVHHRNGRESQLISTDDGNFQTALVLLVESILLLNLQETDQSTSTTSISTALFFWLVSMPIIRLYGLMLVEMGELEMQGCFEKQT